MKALAYFLIIPAAMILDFVLATNFGFYQRYPILPLLLIVTGLFFLIRLLFRKFTVLRLFLALAGLTLSGFYGWWVVSYSTYPALENTVAIGAQSDVMSLELNDSAGETRTLSEIQGDSAAIMLIFYRGYWCPYCISELAHIQTGKALFDEANVALAAVTVDEGEALKLAKTKASADFPILSDNEGKLIDVFGLRHKGGNAIDGSDISRPAIIVLNREGKLIYSEYTDNYRVRPSPKKLAANITERLKQ
ncbi:redoxin domain-containing protein [Verrucomicrobiales bacterium BCK34]|nr:redoxin domain-containing protein [Verrucomicrobiales bacterium BCK34]